MFPLAIRVAVFTKVSLAKYTSQRVWGVNISHYAYECFGATRRYAWRCHVPAALSPPVIEDAVYRAALTISLNEVRVPRTRGDNASARIYDSASGVGEARDRCITLSHAFHSESQLPFSSSLPPCSRMRMIGGSMISIRAHTKPFPMIPPPTPGDNAQFICKSHFAKLSLEMIRV